MCPYLVKKDLTAKGAKEAQRTQRVFVFLCFLMWLNRFNRKGRKDKIQNLCELMCPYVVKKKGSTKHSPYQIDL